MALSAPPPPPPDPPSSSTTTNRPLLPRPPPPHSLPHPHLYLPHPIPSTARLPSNLNPNFPQQLAPKAPPPHPNSNLLYPVASSGRGYLQKPISVPPNPNNPTSKSSFSIYTSRPGGACNNLRHPSPMIGYDNRSHQDSISGQLGKGLGLTRPPAHLQPKIVGPSSTGGVVGSGNRVMPIPFSKVGMSDNYSLYALCRSWLRNGFPEETQPQYIDIVKSLPRPLPLDAQDSHSPAKRKYDEEEEDGGFVEHLSARELLQRHIKRAKRVRSCLREERLRRIGRYKTRLALLLPPMVNQHLRNDSTAGDGNAS